MATRYLFALVVVMLAGLLLATAVSGQSGIILGGADTVRTEETGAYGGPVNMVPRVVTQFANNVRQFCR
jgi:hypothetical protein